MIDLVERCVRYMMKVECKWCGSEVYPDEDEARAQAERWVESDDMQDIEDLKERIDRECDGCRHMLESG
jgi:hypothetical protein